MSSSIVKIVRGYSDESRGNTRRRNAQNLPTGPACKLERNYSTLIEFSAVANNAVGILPAEGSEWKFGFTCVSFPADSAIFAVLLTITMIASSFGFDQKKQVSGTLAALRSCTFLCPNRAETRVLQNRNHLSFIRPQSFSSSSTGEHFVR